MKPLIHGAVGRSALKRASTVWWTIMGLVSLLLAGSVASDSHPVELMAWIGRFAGAAFALLLCIWGLHRITCWFVNAFANLE
ncbi:hypothetical protein [Variovorax soli]|uniref:hypothetical protein n=1 Tax=Variovorax soli TaxID=376815 RepID=UPI000B04F4EE|nr:hypothetical protein [Variovorax soli]